MAFSHDTIDRVIAFLDAIAPTVLGEDPPADAAEEPDALVLLEQGEPFEQGRACA